MPAPAAAALPLLMLMAQAPGEPRPGIHQAACKYLVNGVCSDNLPSAGNGGQGGNVIYNIIIQPSQGGAGGNGGDVRSGAAKGAGKGGPTPGLAAIAPPPSVTAAPGTGRCTLTIAGEPVVDHKDCAFDQTKEHFAFTAESLNQKYTYRARVAFNEDRTGQGTLSGGKTSAVRDLGRMTREKACWVSEDLSVKLCAWRK